MHINLIGDRRDDIYTIGNSISRICILHLGRSFKIFIIYLKSLRIRDISVRAQQTNRIKVCAKSRARVVCNLMNFHDKIPFPIKLRSAQLLRDRILRFSFLERKIRHGTHV